MLLLTAMGCMYCGHHSDATLSVECRVGVGRCEGQWFKNRCRVAVRSGGRYLNVVLFSRYACQMICDIELVLCGIGS